MSRIFQAMALVQGIRRVWYVQSVDIDCPLLIASVQGTLLETKHNGNWMRMLVDKKGLVISITYFGHAPVTANNWMALYGLHESYLNGICSRYADDMIPDLKG